MIFRPHAEGKPLLVSPASSTVGTPLSFTAFVMALVVVSSIGLWTFVIINNGDAVSPLLSSASSTDLIFPRPVSPVTTGQFVYVTDDGNISVGFDDNPWTTLALSGDVQPLADGAYGQIGQDLILLGGSLNGYGTPTDDVYLISLRTNEMTKLNSTGAVTPVLTTITNPYSVAE